MKKKISKSIIEKIMNKIKNTKPEEKFIDLETGKEVTLDEVFGDNNHDLKKMDRWVEKMILGDPSVRFYQKRPYPYKNYNKVDELLRTYGKELINKLEIICPLIRKQCMVEDRENLIDSIAFIIFSKKLDIHSLIPNVPEFGNMWDRISEDGYAK